MPLVDYEYFDFVLLTCIPATFMFLWTLIFGDFKNFTGSRKAYSVYTAKDPVNCFQSYTGMDKRKDSS